MYFDLHRRDLQPQVTEAQQALFDTGHKIGALAHLVFPDGKDATFQMNGRWALAIERTNAWIAQGISTIYEATFSANGVFAALDILHNNRGEKWAIEVKSSTSVKDYQITDASFQYFVMQTAGFAPDKFFIMHVNPSYVKQGDIDPADFFHLEDITARVLSNQGFVREKLTELNQMLEVGTEPNKSIGTHCEKPFACDYMHHCWAHLPENNVFKLFNARGKDWLLYEQGITSLEQIPLNFPLSSKQTIQVESINSNQDYIDLNAIQAFLGGIEEPVYFFDFETIHPAIPVLNRTKPFSHVPFQYSIHVTDLMGHLIDYKSFLADPGDFSNPTQRDPRWQLIQQLKADIGSTGSIVVYNSRFEIARLKELALSFPEESGFLDSLLPRILDLWVPFSSFWYYKPAMGDSSSIKSVLPAIAPDFTYDNLDIGNGSLASATFHAMVEHSYVGDPKATMNQLLAYCERDTEGMVVIYRHLKQLME